MDEILDILIGQAQQLSSPSTSVIAPRHDASSATLQTTSSISTTSAVPTPPIPLNQQQQS
ncbi:hypothetical protein Sjap_020273 [Stephania japonica]|uniref:Uncharacterized protein n=1 Tax=Stephania japonica TaxID=461633 RepID=A0AAP0I0J6_9MAGN